MTLPIPSSLLSLRDLGATNPAEGSIRAEPLRVLHVLDVLRPSGAEVMLKIAGPIWPHHGINAEILTLSETPGPYAGQLASAGYRIHVLAPRPTLTLFGGFANLLRRERYDVVHIHVERANFWLAVVARAQGVGVVQACHGTFQFKGALRLERTIQRRLARLAGVRYIAVGPAVERNERQRFKNRTEVIWNWCDLRHFRPPSESERDAARLRLGVQTPQLAIATVGNCAEVKNHAELIRALATCDELNFVYLHVGDHSADAGTNEIGLVRELGLESRVHFLGFIEDVRSVLHAADLVVVPSRSEGSPLAAVEALGCGLPLIVADVPGLREVAELSPTIQAVTPSAAGLTRAIRTAASVDGMHSGVPEIATRAARAAPFLNPPEGVARYAALYRSTTRANRRHGDPSSP